MKSKIKLTTAFLDKLPGQLADSVAAALKETDIPEEGTEIYRRAGDGNPLELNDAERGVVAYVSTRGVDRDNEIVVPDGVLMDTFRTAPHVLWNHKWSELPIGHDPFIGSNGTGVIARSLLADTTQGLDVWKLIKGQHLRTSSIGFIPISVMTPSNNGWGELMDRLDVLWPEFDKHKSNNLEAVILKSIMLEHSYVSVPANPGALVLAVSSKSLDLSERILKDLGVEVEVVDEIPAVDILDKVPEPDEEVVEPVVPEVKEVKLHARLIARPQAPAIVPKQLEEIVAERLELLTGRI